MVSRKRPELLKRIKQSGVGILNVHVISNLIVPQQIHENIKTMSNGNFVSIFGIFSVEFHTDGCQYSRVTIGSGNGMVTLGNKPITESMMT